LNDDFRKGYLYRGNKEIEIKNQGKGHREEVLAFMNAINVGGQSPISFRSQVLTTLTTFKIIESLQTGFPQDITFEC
jgi:polar amino acid transport system substrate-binding protein